MPWTDAGFIAARAHAPWAVSHAMIPTPLVEHGRLRLYYSACDSEGRGTPTWVDVEPDDPARVRAHGGQLLELGRRGCFDDNGAVVTSVVRGLRGELLLYYVGFELCRQVRYRLFTGLAVSHDDGATFTRFSEAPVLDRSAGEVYFRCGPFVEFHEGRFKMLYIGGDAWTEVEGKEVPVYDLRFIESADGYTWPTSGRQVMTIDAAGEHGFGRPWLCRTPHGNELFFSVRKRDGRAYGLGYATEPSPLRFERHDERAHIPTAPGRFDDSAQCYLAVVDLPSGRWGFYNGNDFGRAGIGVVKWTP